MHSQRSFLAISVIAGVFIASAACGGSSSAPTAPPPAPPPPAPEPAAKLMRVSGDGQSTIRGASLPAPLVVRVTDAHDDPVAGTTVTWSVTEGNGSVSPASVRSAADGSASAVATTGLASAVNAFAAVVPGLAGSPATFVASGTAGAASKLVVVGGASQSGVAGSVLAAPLIIQVRDANGVAVPAATVGWSVAQGGGSVGAPASIADGDGLASVTATLGTAAGPNLFTASAVGFTATSVAFPATGVAGRAAALVRVSPADESFTSGSAQTLTVAARDANGNPVQGAVISWAATYGGGSVATSTSVTDPSGNATCVATLGSYNGLNSFTASAAGLTGSPVTFWLRGTSGAAATLARVSPGDHSVPSGFRVPLTVAVRDANGNGVQGIAVWWDRTSGTGSLPTQLSTTDSLGKATCLVTLGELNGPNTFTASTASADHLTGSPVTFSLPGVSGSASNVIMISPLITGFPAGSAQVLTVRIRDEYGNPVPNFPVSWAKTLGDGSISTPSSVTDAAGNASCLATLGASPGANWFTAASSGLSGGPVTFKLTGT